MPAGYGNFTQMLQGVNRDFGCYSIFDIDDEANLVSNVDKLITCVKYAYMILE